ncbi:LysM peptidoglycan-binding domain-containing protein [Flavobacterium psychrotrophum]|uniref:LysM peptidoglycan-binding domain-containing protein n=1 Tax=Flavobacterium psychrotrophum TaxID=2294119 RepID=UPI000E31EE6E|nr:LysM domain-containing protein [Flavobacterium psychrotrophum]
MKKEYLFLVMCAFLYIGTVQAQEVSTSEDETAVTDAPKENEELVGHKVTQGETIMMIAKKYKVKPKDIYEYNPTATEGIVANSNINIPMHRAYGRPKQKKDRSISQPEGPLYVSGSSATADVPKD